MHTNDFLPEPLPSSPWPLFTGWFQSARNGLVQPNPDAMVIATVNADGRPSARVVLCKQLVANPGYLIFYTNYHSRKGRELATHPQAAAVIHWDTLHRQVRIEGPISTSPPQESDEYFAGRPLVSRIGAWASHQSEPLASRQTLIAQVAAVAQRFGIPVDATDGVLPRPPHWGGYRLWAERIELWIEGPNRVHDRAVWTRDLIPASHDEFTGGEWKATRLNP